MIIICHFTEDNILPFQHLSSSKFLDRVTPFFQIQIVKFMLYDIWTYENLKYTHNENWLSDPFNKMYELLTMIYHSTKIALLLNIKTEPSLLPTKHKHISKPKY